MKNKSWARYLISAFLILLLIFGASNVFRAIEELKAKTYNPQFLYSTASALFFYGGIGLVLGSDHFLSEQRKAGAWHANWPKLLIIGLPALFFSFTFVLYGYGEHFIGKMPLHVINHLANNSWPLVHLFPLILGYSIATGFYKHGA